MADVLQLRAEYERVRALVDDWRSRGSPEPEGSVLQGRLAAAGAALADAMPTQHEPDPVAESPKGTHVSKKRKHRHPDAGAGGGHGNHAVVNREIDARFWAQTGYKPGQPLDMTDPSDKAMSVVWRDVAARVQGENAAGKMVRTFDNPDVKSFLENAKVAHLSALNHIVGASSATDSHVIDEHVRAAKEATTIARDSCAAAAEHQPSSVTKHILNEALAEVARTAPSKATEVAVKGEEALETGHPAPDSGDPGHVVEAPPLANDPWDHSSDGLGTFTPPGGQSSPAPTAPPPAPQQPAPQQPAPHGKHGGKHGHGGGGHGHGGHPPPPVVVRMPEQGAPAPAPAPSPDPGGQGGQGGQGGGTWADKAEVVEAPTQPPPKRSGSPRGRAGSSSPRPQTSSSDGLSIGTVAAVGLGAAFVIGAAVAYARGRSGR